MPEWIRLPLIVAGAVIGGSLAGSLLDAEFGLNGDGLIRLGCALAGALVVGGCIELYERRGGQRVSG